MGDKVLAYNEETGEQAYKPVVHLFRNTSKDWIGLTVNNTEIVSTPGHKYYLPETKQWVSAKVGTVVLLNNGTRAKIEAKREIHYEEPQTTYNFEVAEFHTYYVGTGVLVHNQNCAFEEFYNNPESLWGKSADEVGNALGDGWTKSTYGSKRTGWKYTKGDKLVAYHPGGGYHVGSYYKISSGKGIIKIVGSDYIIGYAERATIIKIIGG